MAEFSIDDVLSQFGEKSKEPVKGTFDIDSIVSKFSSPETTAPVKEVKPRIDVYRGAAPPISDASKDVSDKINADITKIPNSTSGPNVPSISDVAAKAGNITSDEATSGLSTARSGLGDIFSNQPATGIGKISSGLTGLVTSPFEGIGSVAKDITGNEDFGNKASLLSGLATPVKVIAPYSPLRVPTLNNLNPLTKPSFIGNKALSELVDKITSGGRDQQALADTVKAMKADPRIGPADTSPAVLSMAQKLFTTEGDAAKNYLHSTSSNRVGNLGEDVTRAFDAAGGVPVDALKKLNELSAAAKKVGNDMINPALTAAKPVNISNTVSQIDNILKPGVWSKFENAESTLPLSNIKNQLGEVRKYLANKKEMRTDPKDLHEFQSTIRRTAENMLKSGNAGERSLGKHLMDVRNNLVNDINVSAPGYKEGLNAYREEKHIADSFRDGYDNALTTSKKMEARPEFTKEWFDGLTAHEKEAAKEGIMLRYDTEMRVAKNPSLAGTNIGKSDFNKKIMEMALGKEKTEKLLQDLENTRTIKNTHNKLIEGSQTQMRAAGDNAVALPAKSDVNPLNKYVTPAMATAAEMTLGQGTGLGALSTLALAGAAKAGSAMSFKVRTAIAKERNMQIAKLALPTQGPSRDELIRQLEARIPGPKQSLVTRGTNALSRIVGP